MTSAHGPIREGHTFTYERTFTQEDVRLFGQVTGDLGAHHVAPDETGRVMVQGLLTAALPTKLGGDIDFVSRDLSARFHRPVFSGDTITVVATVNEMTPDPGRDRVNLRISWTCTNQLGKVVLDGETSGFMPAARA